MMYLGEAEDGGKRHGMQFVGACVAFACQQTAKTIIIYGSHEKYTQLAAVNFV